MIIRPIAGAGIVWNRYRVRPTTARATTKQSGIIP